MARPTNACLACHAQVAADEWALEHELAATLCLDCLLVVLQDPDKPALSGSGVTPRSLKRRTCAGLVGTCPRPVVRHGINASWCRVCAPPPPTPAPEPIAHATDSGPDDGMAEALSVVLGILPVTILEVWPHPYGAPD